MAIGHSSVSASSQLLSISVLKIAPGNILFVGDAKAGAVFAFELGPAPAASESRAYRLRGIDGKIADLLGVAPGEVVIRDLAVHPVSKEAYVAVERGHAGQAIPVIVRVSQHGELAPLPLDTLPFTRLALSQPASADLVLKGGVAARTLSITTLVAHRFGVF